MGEVEDAVEKVTVSSNKYEEWIKMVTDNKITTQNSWNVALIDYFYDMSLLKDGDRINFQRASGALDGCVRVYASRVDYAANETGKLVNGLTSSADNVNHDEENDTEDGNDEENDQIGSKGRQQRKENFKSRQRDSKATLFSSFDKIRMKDSEKPTKTDPIFKRAITEFDEGGAKSLLNNLLTMDSNGTVIFTSAQELDSRNEWQRVDFKAIEDILKNDKSFGDLSPLKRLIANDLPQGVNLEDSYIQNDSKDEINNENNSDLSSLPISPKKTTNNILAVATTDTLPEIDVFNLSFMLDFDLTDSATICPSSSSLKDIAKGKMNVGELALKLETLPLINANIPHDLSTSANDIDEVEEPELFDKNHSMVMGDDVSKRTQYSLFLDDDDDSDSSQPNLTLTRLFDEHTSEAVSNSTVKKDGYTKSEAIISLFDSLVNKTINYENQYGKSNVFWKIRELRKSLKEEDKASDDNNKRKSKQQKSTTDFDDDEYMIENEEESDGEEDDNTDGKDHKVKSKDYIDFTGGASDEDYAKLEIDDLTMTEAILFSRPQYLSRIVLATVMKTPKVDKYTLNDELNFTAKRLAYLSLKPKKELNNVLTGGVTRSASNTILKYSDKERENLVANSSFFANKYQDNITFNDEPIGDILNNDDIEEFDVPDFDAWDLEEPVDFSNGPKSSQSQHWLISQRNNQIAFSKKSKRVDIRLLKANIWESIEEQTYSKKRVNTEQITREDNETDQNSTIISSSEDDLDPNTLLEKNASSELMFTDIINDAMKKYSGDKKGELSTSYCFISLLHLANEQGLILQSTDENDDIVIKR